MNDKEDRETEQCKGCRARFSFADEDTEEE